MAEERLILDFNREFRRLMKRYGLEFVELAFKLLKSKAAAEAYLLFLEKGELTAGDVTLQAWLPESTAYKVLKRLEWLGFIKKAWKERRPRGVLGGPRATVWVLKVEQT